MFPAYAHLSAYDRHKKLINDYFLLKGGSFAQLKRDTSRDKTDHDVIRENHKFLWNEETEEPDTWGARLAKRYYDKLFKEYCICDLAYYRHNKVALRWRTEKEVVVGKGQYECGNKKCTEKDELRSWEVNFGYVEHGEKKNALVKLRLCPECSVKLNYKSKKREVKRKKGIKRLREDSVISTDASSSTDKPDTIVTIELSDTSDEVENSAKEVQVDENKIWKEKPTEQTEKSREDEFEEYLADLLF